MSRPDPVVRLHAVAKRYGRTRPWVLRDVDLDVRPGSTIELRGANDAGKSTLLRLLAGASAPSRGRRDAAPRLRVGYAPQSLEPAPCFDAGAYLRHHERIRGLTGDSAAALARRLGLEPLLGERLGELSVGSLHKVVLAQALLGAPQLVALDEPFSHLDADARGALAALLRERAAAGAAVVLSDHREGGARHGADAVWQLAEGRVR